VKYDEADDSVANDPGYKHGQETEKGVEWREMEKVLVEQLSHGYE